MLGGDSVFVQPVHQSVSPSVSRSLLSSRLVSTSFLGLEEKRLLRKQLGLQQSRAHVQLGDLQGNREEESSEECVGMSPYR